MAVNLDITYDKVDAASKALVTGMENINGELNRLLTLVQDLVGDGFHTDKASNAFLESFTELQSGILQASNGLSGMSKFLSAVSSTYSQVDNDLATSVKGAL